jgi:hypothetical protein
MEKATLLKDAKQKDVRAPIDVNQIKDNQRAEMLEAIAKKNYEENKDDFIPIGDIDADQKFENIADSDDLKISGNEEEPKGREGVADGLADDADGQKNVSQQDETKEELVTIKVDGVEKQVPLSEIHQAGIAAYQKIAAADKRLEEATLLLREAKAARAKQEYDTGTQQTQESKKTRQEIELEQKSQKANETLQGSMDNFAQAQAYGSPAEIKKALEEYQNAWANVNRIEQQKSYSPDQIDQLIEQRMRERDLVEQEKRNKEIMENLSLPPEEGGFKDLLDDERLYQLMQYEAEKMLQNGAPNRLETYQEAGINLRKFLKMDTSAKKENTNDSNNKQTDDLTAKRNRKIRETDYIQTSNIATPSNFAEKTKTREQILHSGIEHLRTLRGQVN